MRKFLFVLMILMLPLRGWIGDAMATQMALHGTAPLDSRVHASADAAGVDGGSMTTQQAPSTAHADCMDHGAPDDPPTDAHCPTCSLCQACNSAVITVSLSGVPAVPYAPLVPGALAPRFASAERALGQKPPIS